MSRISELIANLCPDGVEYKLLGELGEFYGGLNGKSKADFENGNARYITYMNVYSNIAVKTDVEDKVKIGKNEKQNKIQQGDVLFTGSSETADECAISSVVENPVTEPIYLNSFCFGFRMFDGSLYLPAFLKYLFRSNEVRKQLTNTANGVTRFNVSKKKMAGVMIPVPPLAVQKEIVRILDAYTDENDSLIRELEAELAARRKQYEQYKEKLLSFDDRVERKPLVECVQEIDNIKWNGTDSQYQYIELSSIENDFHRIGNTTLITAKTAPSRAQQIVKEDDVLFGTTRPMLKRYCIVPKNLDGQICSTGFCVLRAKNDEALPLWLFFAVSTNSFINQVGRFQKEGSYPAISDKDLLSCRIPVPHLPEQRRIVEILDKFDALCNDETAGLRAEIAARKKQYEHYRERLLTFKRKQSA